MAYFIGKHEENATKSDSIDSYLINKRGEVENYWLAQQEFDSINSKRNSNKNIEWTTQFAVQG